MKRYALLKLWPVWNGSANKVIAETINPLTLKDAIDALQQHCPLKLDERGYAKEGEISWVLAECYEDSRVCVNA